MSTQWLQTPIWFAGLVNDVMDDLTAELPLAGIELAVVIDETAEMFGVGVYERDGTGRGAGSAGMVSPTWTHDRALLVLSGDLQEACAETAVGWGQSRPACPYHPHPLRPCRT